MDSAVAIVGAVAGIAALFLAIWLGLPSRRLAQRDLNVVRSLKIELNGSDADHCVWVLPWASDTAFMIELDITLTNEGNRSVEEIMVELDMPKVAYLPDFHREPGGGARVARIEQGTDPVEGTERTKVFFKVPSVPPGVAVHISDYLFLPVQSRYRDSVEAKTKDDVAVRAQYEFVFGWAVRVSAMARDLAAARGRFTIYSFVPEDKSLAPLADANGALAALAKALEDPTKPEMATAIILTPSVTDEAPENMQKALGVSLRRARLGGAQAQAATYVKGVGYLPLKMEQA